MTRATECLAEKGIAVDWLTLEPGTPNWTNIMTFITQLMAVLAPLMSGCVVPPV
jgi:hypothetical protein